MGLFAGIKEAKKGYDSNYERPGKYWQRIDACKEIENRKKVKFAALEKTIIKVIDDDHERGHLLGENIAHLIKKNDSFLGTVKALVMGVMGIDDESDVDEDLCDKVFCEDSLFAGTVVECSSRVIVTKEGKDFTVVNYMREVPPEELLGSLEEDVIERFFKTPEMTGKEWLEALAGVTAE